jgi:hypothetical protein
LGIAGSGSRKFSIEKTGKLPFYTPAPFRADLNFRHLLKKLTHQEPTTDFDKIPVNRPLKLVTDRFICFETIKMVILKASKKINS